MADFAAALVAMEPLAAPLSNRHRRRHYRLRPTLNNSESACERQELCGHSRLARIIWLIAHCRQLAPICAFSRLNNCGYVALSLATSSEAAGICRRPGRSARRTVGASSPPGGCFFRSKLRNVLPRRRGQKGGASASCSSIRFCPYTLFESVDKLIHFMLSAVFLTLKLYLHAF